MKTTLRDTLVSAAAAKECALTEHEISMLMTVMNRGNAAHPSSVTHQRAESAVAGLVTHKARAELNTLVVDLLRSEKRDSIRRRHLLALHRTVMKGWSPARVAKHFRVSVQNAWQLKRRGKLLVMKHASPLLKNWLG